jgi:hypothetical protein
MTFKVIAFVIAAIPVFLFIRSVFFQRNSPISDKLAKFKKQADLAVWVFLFLIGCTVVITAGKLAWTWMSH